MPDKTTKEKISINQVQSYLEEHFSDLMDKCIESKIVPTLCGIEVSKKLAETENGSGSIINMDIMESEFNDFYYRFPEAGLDEFIRSICWEGHEIIVEINAPESNSAGLEIAKRNRSAMSFIYTSPKRQMEKKEVILLETELNSKLIKAGIPNAVYKVGNPDAYTLEGFAAKTDNKMVLLSYNAPNAPFSYPLKIAEIAKDSPNVDMVVAPNVHNMFSKKEKDSILLKMSSENLKIEGADDSFNPEEFCATCRMYTAAQQYYALKAALAAGASLYRESHYRKGFPFFLPTHYVSTIEPKKK